MLRIPEGGTILARRLSCNKPSCMRTFLFTLALLSTLATAAQDVAAFTDYMDRFHVFDRGSFSQIDWQLPKQYRMGGNYIVYASKNSDLRMYRDGEISTLERTDQVFPTVTDHYFGYLLAGVLKIHDGKDLNVVCYNTEGHIIEDSLAAYYDRVNQRLSVYYEGNTIVLEDALAQWPLENWKSGDNVLAYVTTFEKKFKVFYQGNVYEVMYMVDSDLSYKAGCDLVAYQDVVDKGFKAFYQGRFLDIEPIMPTRYEVGKGIMAYQDINGELKVFEDGKIYTALDFPTQEWYVADSLVIIKDQNFLKVFDNGKLHVVERFWPSDLQASWGSLAYVDQNRKVKVWRSSGTAIVTNGEPVTKIQLDRGLLIATLNVNTVKVGWHGEVYKH